MSRKEMIEETLSLNEGVPLFDFNVNFTALKGLLVQFNIQLNSQKEEIDELRMHLRTKADRESMETYFGLLNGAMNLSADSLDTLEVKRPKYDGSRPIDQLCQKAVFMTKGLDKVLADGLKERDLMKELEKAVTEKVREQTKLLTDKISNIDETLKKNMDLYFKDTNSNFVRLYNMVKDGQNKYAGNLSDCMTLISKKVNYYSLRGHLDNLESKMQIYLKRLLDADCVKRANQANELIMKMKDGENAANDRQQSLQNKLAELIEKIGKSLTLQGFEKEKTKIFEKMSEQKARLDDLTRKAEDYMDYKRSTIMHGYKIKQETLTMMDDIAKLKEKADASTSLGNVSMLLEKIDPHKMCYLEAAVKLHTELIAKLYKASLGTGVGPMSPVTPAANVVAKSGLSPEETRKFIKYYVTNLDLYSRIKACYKSVSYFARRVDCISDLEKKLYAFTKYFDFGGLTRYMNKKCNSEDTRKYIKITNGKIDQLHEFLKMLRKDLDMALEFIKKNEYKTKEPSDNALLTGKKLYPLNCLSCFSGSTRQKNNRSIRMAMGEASLYVDMTEDDYARRTSLNVRKK